MPTRTYGVNHTFSSPEMFYHHLMAEAYHGRLITISATRIDSDELSSRRTRDVERQITFKLEVQDVSALGTFPIIVSGVPFGLEGIGWARLAISNTSVQLDIYS